MPTASYDEIADWYEEKFLGRQRAGVEAQRDDSLGINPRCATISARRRGTCLELGCGTGVYAAGRRELGWTPR